VGNGDGEEGTSIGVELGGLGNSKDYRG